MTLEESVAHGYGGGNDTIGQIFDCHAYFFRYRTAPSPTSQSSLIRPYVSIQRLLPRLSCLILVSMELILVNYLRHQDNPHPTAIDPSPDTTCPQTTPTPTGHPSQPRHCSRYHRLHS